MSERLFRTLRPDEIECRIQSLNEGKGENAGKVFATCLLYKDARCDQRILDETIGPMCWQRRHEEHNNNLFCSVGIKDKETGEWVWKEDAGAESNQEAEKGHASDSFKRACFNWGIGRELYTAPFIYFQLEQNEYYQDDKRIKATSRAKFKVGKIEYDGDSILHVTIIDKKGNKRFEK